MGLRSQDWDPERTLGRGLVPSKGRPRKRVQKRSNARRWGQFDRVPGPGPGDGDEGRVMVGFDFDEDRGDPGHALKLVEGSVQQEGEIAHPAQFFRRFPGASGPLQLELKSLDRGENCHSHNMAPLRVGGDF